MWSQGDETVQNVVDVTIQEYLSMMKKYGYILEHTYLITLETILIENCLNKIVPCGT